MDEVNTTPSRFQDKQLLPNVVSWGDTFYVICLLIKNQITPRSGVIGVRSLLSWHSRYVSMAATPLRFT
jgi:hypothetical protein